jgi:fatty-acyl-CoA synthase
MSWLELEEASRRAASGLRGKGVEPGDPVALLGSTSLDLLVALFGTWRAGAIPTVLALPRRIDLQAYLEDVAGRVTAAGARVLAVDDTLLPPDLPLDLLPVPVVPMHELAASQPIPDPTPSDPGTIALLQFTSGTTAGSRAVTLQHRHILTNLNGAIPGLGADRPDTVILSWLPLFHDMGLIGMLLGAVTATCPLYLLPPEEFMARPGAWMDAMSKYRGTVTASPNFGFGLAARDLRIRPRPLDLSALLGAGSGAEPIDHETMTSFMTEAGKYGFRPEHFCPMYGLAENTLAVTTNSPGTPVRTVWVSREELETSGSVVAAEPSDRDARVLVSCGSAMSGVEISILDEKGEDLGAGRVGEICIGGSGVMAGYWRDEEKTAEAIRDGLLHTGDLGFLDEQGELFVTGRIKDVIIVGGRNLSAEDYEFVAERVPGVRMGNAIAFAVPEREHVVVVAETTTPAGEAEAVARSVMQTLRERLPRGPEEVVLVPPGTLPKTSSGKRRRGACREQYSAGSLPAVAVATR